MLTALETASDTTVLSIPETTSFAKVAFPMAVDTKSSTISDRSIELELTESLIALDTAFVSISDTTSFAKLTSSTTLGTKALTISDGSIDKELTDSSTGTFSSSES